MLGWLLQAALGWLLPAAAAAAASGESCHGWLDEQGVWWDSFQGIECFTFIVLGSLVAACCCY